MGPEPLGPQAHLGLAPLGSWAHLGPGPTWAPGPLGPWAHLGRGCLSSKMGTCHSSTGLPRPAGRPAGRARAGSRGMPARPAGRPAGRASSRNPPNLDPARDKPASAAPFSGICRGRPTCWTSGRSGGQFLGAFGDVRLGRSGKGQKTTKTNQNEVLYSGKCSHTPGESF